MTFRRLRRLKERRPDKNNREKNHYEALFEAVP
jgi:hypothetical protein